MGGGPYNPEIIGGTLPAGMDPAQHAWYDTWELCTCKDYVEQKTKVEPPLIAAGSKLRFKASGRKVTVVDQRIERYCRVRFENGEETDVLRNDLLENTEEAK